MSIPIVLAAFGTTTRAMKTYSFIDAVCRERFPGHAIHWAFSSRIVRDRSNKVNHTDMRRPEQVLTTLGRQGHEWAVVQSLHLTCGHEFYRLIDDVKGCGLRTAIGLPLLNAPEDYEEIVRTLIHDYPKEKDEALVLVGHGTDHHSWCCYTTLDHMFGKNGRSGVYVGVVECGYPPMESVVADVVAAGFRKVRLVPFLLVAGMHFEEDLSGDKDSWRRAFEEVGVEVSLEPNGLGFNAGVVDIFCRHIEEALDVIPENEAAASDQRRAVRSQAANLNAAD